MIIKSLSKRSNVAGALKYILGYSLDSVEKSKDRSTVILKHNLRSRSLNGYVREYLENESFRVYHRKNNILVFHEILSWAADDKKILSNDILKDIARKYVELRAQNSLAIITRHSDTEKEHLHAIVSAVTTAGYSNRMSKAAFRKFKIKLENYSEKTYPQLKLSHIEHGNIKSKSKEEIITATKAVRQTDKQKLLSFLKQNLEKAKSKEDLINQLQEKNYQPYFRNEKWQGIVVNGKKFRLVNLEGFQEKIELLNENISFEEMQLQELQGLREGRIKQRIKEIKTIEKDKQILKSDEENELNELQSLRDKHKQKEKAIEINIQENNSTETIKSDSDYDPNLYTKEGMPLFSPFAFVKPNLFMERENEE